MEKDAFRRLKELSLPFPKTFQLEDLLKEASPDSLYFIRYRNETDLPKYVSSEYLSEHSSLFSRLMMEGKISQIANTIITQIGGCIVTRGAERYIELVAGHVSGLLLHGWCYARVYLCDNNAVTVLIPQMQMIEQLPYINRVAPASVIGSDLLSYLVSSCNTLLQGIDSKCLLEFIVSDEHQIYFVDIKDYKWQVNFAALVSEGKENRLIYGGRDRLDVLANVYDGDFGLNNLKVVNQSTTIRLADHALLSHFITYSLKKKITAIIK